MKEQESFWQRIGLHEWFLKEDLPEKEEVAPSLTPDKVYHYILEKFKESIKELSFANRIIFYHEYIICFNTEDYHDFTERKKGLFGLIAQEVVKEFHAHLKGQKQKGRLVVPSSSKWVFRFVSHPSYARGDIGFIGKLLPDTSLHKEDNLRVTYIPRQTGIAQTVDINEEVLAGFHYYSDGYYELPFQDIGGDLPPQEVLVQGNKSASKAKLETILPDKAFAGKKLQYFITEDLVTVTGSESKEEGGSVFRIPSEWVNSPHLQIRFDGKEGKFYVASFGEKTIVNEQEVERSSEDAPEWKELPINSHIVLNGIVGINIFRA